MGEDYSRLIAQIVGEIEKGNAETGRQLLERYYPYHPYGVQHRSYTVKQKMAQYIRDGFIDRYSGKRLVNPGILKVLSVYYPAEFPYHPHWKMSETHIAYWELSPTIDHVIPISAGGTDDPSNWVTTSMMNNAIKSNWTLEQLRWELYPAGDINAWDGLTAAFIRLVTVNPILLKDPYIKIWHHASSNG